MPDRSVGAGTLVLRLDDVLVGIVGDTDDTIERCRAAFAAWIDDSQPDIAPAFDLRLDAAAGDSGVRSVPQLRHGASVVARSRRSDDVLAALDATLGGVRAQRREPSRTWTFLRPFVHGDRMVLVDARSPMLVNDPLLERAGIVELATWAVAIAEPDDSVGAVVDVPPALTVGGAERRYRLVGAVAVGAPAGDGAGTLLARYGTRHTSPTWFQTVAALVDADRFLDEPDRASARDAIARLLDPITPGV